MEQSGSPAAFVQSALTTFADEQDDDIELDDLMTEAVDKYGWPDVREAIFGVLESASENLWAHAAAALYGAASDGRDLDTNRTIALVYHRLGNGVSEHDANLAWSIASKLRNVGYLSSYDPASDPDVAAEIARLRNHS